MTGAPVGKRTFKLLGIALWRRTGERERDKREEGDGGDGEEGGGRGSYGRCERRTQGDHGAVRSTRVQEKREDQEVGGPNRGWKKQTPGSRVRPPSMLQEKHGRVRCPASAPAGKRTFKLLGIALWRRRGEQERDEREEGDGGDGEEGGGRGSYGRCERRTQGDHLAVRSTRVREKGEDQEVGGPNRGRKEQTPGSRVRPPPTHQEKRGRVRYVEVA
ncbi:hypothetical protein NDU88_006557 [Pleurodeles waltl]|uniref:Uncharacterized protein n=1 Tax=Pleurodeles waltl TaxID=8319 RepID=A0AAV7PNT6_PLEWA|nr:hypothetical protein NDU88_006557 [Pleurodeles waltl]